MQDLDLRRGRVREIVKKRPPYAELLPFLLGVIEAREKAALEFDPGEPAPADERFRLKMQGGLPALDPVSLPLDPEALRRFLEPILSLLEKRKPDEIKAVRGALADGRMDPAALVRKALSGAAMEERGKLENGLDSGVAAFLARHAAAGLLGRHAQQYEPILASISWEHGYCPVCGGTPHMAELRGPEGKRFLACGACGYCWNFPRVTCPFCGNTDQKRLGYFQAEEEKEYRVDYCTACRKYIKTVDLRERETPVDLEIEAAATLHLDMLVQPRGYDPPIARTVMP